MNLEKLNLTELDAQELRIVDGGVIPAVVAVGWGIMAVCSVVALGMKEALNEHKNK